MATDIRATATAPAVALHRPTVRRSEMARVEPLGGLPVDRMTTDDPHDSRGISNCVTCAQDDVVPVLIEGRGVGRIAVRDLIP